MTVDVQVLRIANCSGGDRLSAARDVVEGGTIEVLTGDYLAGLTMATLHGKRLQDAAAGYGGASLKQLRNIIGASLERGIKIVSNASGLNPKGCANAVEAILDEFGLQAKVAWIDGDDLAPRLDDLFDQGDARQPRHWRAGSTHRFDLPCQSDAILTR